MTDENMFERLNFFTGMFATADDWNAGEDYHIRKLKLHHEGLHKPGVICGFKHELEVKCLPFRDGGFELEVSPGAAIDGDGNIIYLASRRTVRLKAPADPSKYSYVYIRYAEKPHRFVSNDVVKDYDGATRCAEDPVVDSCDKEPDNKNYLELARIQLTHDATKIHPYKEGEYPSNIEIDRKGVQWSLSTEELETRHEKLKADHEDHLKVLDGQVRDLDCRLQTEEATSFEHGERLNALDAKVDDHEVRLGREEDTSIAHAQRLDGLDDQVSQLDDRLTLDEGVLTLVVATTAVQDTRLDEHKVRLDEQDARLRDLAAVSVDLDARVTNEENRSAYLDRRLKIVEDICENLNADVGGLTHYSRVHYRGSHTLGIIPQEGEQLQVKAAGGLNVRVLTGAALDREGRTLVIGKPRTLIINRDSLQLPQLVFVAIRYNEDNPSIASLKILADLPADEPWVELARIDLRPGVTDVADPADPARPVGNEIDRRSVPVSGAIAVREQGMSVTVVQRIVQVMERSRRSFADLDMQFPTPSVSDARNICLTVETLTRVGRLHLGQLTDLMTTAATIEQDIIRELNEKYKKLLNTTVEFDKYMSAVRDLQFALRKHDPEEILSAQDGVALAAHNLSHVAIEAPTANAGRDQELVTYDDRLVVILDASASQARGGRTIEQHRWTVSAS